MNIREHTIINEALKLIKAGETDSGIIAEKIDAEYIDKDGPVFGWVEIIANVQKAFEIIMVLEMLDDEFTKVIEKLKLKDQENDILLFALKTWIDKKLFMI